MDATFGCACHAIDGQNFLELQNPLNSLRMEAINYYRCQCPIAERSGFCCNNTFVKHTHTRTRAGSCHYGRLIELSKPITALHPRTRHIHARGRGRKNGPCYYRCHSFGDPGVYFRHKETSFQSGRATPNFRDRVRVFLERRARLPRASIDLVHDNPMSLKLTSNSPRRFPCSIVSFR